MRTDPMRQPVLFLVPGRVHQSCQSISNDKYKWKTITIKWESTAKRGLSLQAPIRSHQLTDQSNCLDKYPEMFLQQCFVSGAYLIGHDKVIPGPAEL